MQKKLKGLTMVEMAVAVGLLFLTSSFTMSMFVAGSRAPLQAEQLLDVSQCQQRLMDRVLASVDKELEGGDITIDPQSALGFVGIPATGFLDKNGDVTNQDGPYRYRIEAKLGTPEGEATTLDHFIVFDVSVTGPNGKSLTARALRRRRSYPPTLPPAPPAGADPDDLYAPDDPQVEEGSDIIAEQACDACHDMSGSGSNSESSAAPAWTRATIERSAAASGKTVQEYIMARVSGESNLVNSNIRPGAAGRGWGTMPQQVENDTQARAVAAAVMQRMGIPAK